MSDFFFFFLVSRYLGHDTIHVSPAQVSRCIDASMHRYALNVYHVSWLIPRRSQIFLMSLPNAELALESMLLTSTSMLASLESVLPR